jgi:membrane protein DedA with SNARE-associated domain
MFSSTASLINYSPYLGIFVLFVLGLLGLPFPEDATLMLCGFLLASDVIQPIPAFLVIYPSLLGTDFLLYSFGKKYGRKLVEHRRFHRILKPERLAKLEAQFQKRGSLFVLLGRQLLGLRAQIFIVAGIMRISALKFVLADAVSAIFTIAIMVGIGYAGGNTVQIVKKDITKIKYIILALVVLALAGWIIFRYVQKIKKPKQNKMENT